MEEIIYDKRDKWIKKKKKGGRLRILDIFQ